MKDLVAKVITSIAEGMLVDCWCGKETDTISQADVRAGKTFVCGRRNCGPR